jgi:hypothetical protein
VEREKYFFPKHASKIKFEAQKRTPCSVSFAFFSFSLRSKNISPETGSKNTQCACTVVAKWSARSQQKHQSSGGVGEIWFEGARSTAKAPTCYLTKNRAALEPSSVKEKESGTAAATFSRSPAKENEKKNQWTAGTRDKNHQSPVPALRNKGLGRRIASAKPISLACAPNASSCLNFSESINESARPLRVTC